MHAVNADHNIIVKMTLLGAGGGFYFGAGCTEWCISVFNVPGRDDFSHVPTVAD